MRDESPLTRESFEKIVERAQEHDRLLEEMRAEEAAMQTLALSEDALALLRHLVTTDDQTVTPDNLEAYRELVRVGFMTPFSGMVGGPETHFIFTEDGWNYAQSLAHPAGSL